MIKVRSREMTFAEAAEMYEWMACLRLGAYFEGDNGMTRLDHWAMARYCRQDLRHRPDSTTVIYHFRDEEDAALFRLTWG